MQPRNSHIRPDLKQKTQQAWETASAVYMDYTTSAFDNSEIAASALPDQVIPMLLQQATSAVATGKRCNQPSANLPSLRVFIMR
jgi:hypothetical protein